MFKITPNWSAAVNLLHDLARVHAVLDHFEFAREKDEITEYLALCPVHDDHNPSLVVFHDPRNKARPIGFFCRAGCAEDDVIHLLRERERAQTIQDSADEDQESMTPSFTSSAPPIQPASWAETLQYSPLAQAAVHSGVPLPFLRDHPDLPLSEDTATGRLHYIFTGVEGPLPGPVSKWRTFTKKDFGWINPPHPAPPFYPVPAQTLDEEFCTTEGESDLSLALYGGFNAYTLTAGAKTPLDERIAEELFSRGVRRWLIFWDDDTPGRACRDNIVRICLQAGITPVPIDLYLLRDPFAGGGCDLRDFRHRLTTPEAIQTTIRDLIKQSESRLDRYIPAFEDAYALREEEADELVEDIVAPGSISMIVARPGVGKTTIIMALLAAARDGTSLLEKKVLKHNVLLVTEEGTRSLWKKRSIFGPLPNCRLHSVDFGLLDPDDFAETVRIIGDVARRNNVQTIILDTLFATAPVEDEDRAAKVRPVFRLLRSLSRQNFGVLVTVHSRKSAGTGVDVIAGTTALPAEVDVILELAPAQDADPTHRQLTWLKSRLNPDIVAQGPTTLTTEKDHLVLLEGPDSAKVRDQRILDICADGLWHTTAELADALGISTDLVRHPLDRLSSGTGSKLEKERCDGKTGKKGTYRFRLPKPLDLSGLTVH